ncbi:hypothetical protein [Mycolicibacterium mageritense]|uniref:hypothetical protein n=1 Tax=Mycolicibacterium mageritense TaxID=53462 RepID=UPI0011D51313|nr:hypothetical protein [Mycolicibacterium mageritense]TXI64313.1 MAG: hypothetical protein E6Q55_06300 [Mycolicibacterium mageritense]
MAVVLGISAGAVGGEFTVASDADLRSMLSPHRWPAHTIDARCHTADLNITAIKTLREGTSRKYRYLIFAHGVQAAGVFLLALFALKVIFG